MEIKAKVHTSTPKRSLREDLPTILKILKKKHLNPMGGNCGMFALAIKQLYPEVDLVVLYNGADVDDPSEILFMETDVYHVAIYEESHEDLLDGDGVVQLSHIQEWIFEEYGDSHPGMAFMSDNPSGFERLIRTDTNWSVSKERFIQAIKGAVN